MMGSLCQIQLLIRSWGILGGCSVCVYQFWFVFSQSIVECSTYIFSFLLSEFDISSFFKVTRLSLVCHR